ncbi:DoxX family membrane protein [Microbacterium sediminicola]|uniref:DoxX family membrane protein n=1 Tax=Microbacterium sediminicola TaxID=415210 RepID=A0ABN2I510_9MICO
MTRSASLIAPIVVGAMRVTLGVLWLLEGLFKYQAHFDGGDILLVGGTPRVPDWFDVFPGSAMQAVPGLFGAGIPLLETGLGVALVLGVLTLPAAIGSLFTLLLYWSSDQLIDQYPVMAVLSVVILLAPAAARRFSLSALLLARRSPSPAVARWL